MVRYEIQNTITGLVLGVYDADSEEEALEAMARDAGYESAAAAAVVAPTKPGEILVTEIDEEE